jgi:hypothetical protein
MTRPGKSFSIFRYRYMVASGLPECRDDHAEAVAEFALDLLDIVSRFNKSNQLANLNRPTLAVRAGIHTGPVIAGIIGDKKFCYDVWGAGVDGASAMEQSGVADRIHLSQSTAQRLGGLYHMDPCTTQPERSVAAAAVNNEVAAKRGSQTYFLTGRSKRVDFTGYSDTADTAEQAGPGGETADGGPTTSTQAAKLNGDSPSPCPPNGPPQRPQRPRRASVRVERERRQSSTW